MKTEQEIDEILRKNRESLSEHRSEERRRTDPTQPERPEMPRFALVWNRRWALGAAVVAAAIVALWILFWLLSRGSLPGQTLYPLKVGLYEETAALTRLTNSAKAAYATTRLERRLAELKAIAAKPDDFSPESLSPVASNIADHTVDLLESSGSDNTSVTFSQLDTTSKAISIMGAYERVINTNERLAPIADLIEAADESVSNRLSSQIDSVAARDQTEILTYIGGKLDILETLLQSPTLDSRTRDRMHLRLEGAEESLADNDMREALYAVLRAEETAAVAQYAGTDAQNSDETRNASSQDASTTTDSVPTTSTSTQEAN